MRDDNEFPPLPSQAQQKAPLPVKRLESHPVGECEQSAASLMSLPDELLVEILDYLPGIDLQHFQLLTLASLSLTNRRLHHVVSDRLYAAYDSFFCTPYPFLRTVICNPGLASHVRSLSIKYGRGVHADRPTYNPSIADKKGIKDCFKQLGIPDWKTWASDCNDEKSEQEHLYASILMHTTKVTNLYIDDGVVYRGDVVDIPSWLKLIRGAVNGRAYGHVHQFNSLALIRIDVQYLKLRHLAPIFRLRSLRKVALIGLVEWAHTEKDQPKALRRLLPMSSSLVDELHLEKSFVHSDVLDILISSIRQLKAFRYWSSSDRFNVNGHGSDDYWRISHREGYEPFEDERVLNDNRSLLKSLLIHRSSLRDFSFRDGLDTYMLDDTPGTLFNFEKLTHIELPMGMLLGEYEKFPVMKDSSFLDNLPRSAQYLTMHNLNGVYYKRQLDYMGFNCHAYAPLLQTIKVVHHVTEKKAKYDWERFRKLLIEQGILFMLERAHCDDDQWSYTDDSDSLESYDSTSDEESLYSD